MNKTLIIAEAGVNHNGSFELAKRLVDEAVEAGCDVVKFQTSVNPANVTSRFAQKAQYQKQTTGSDENQLEMLRKLFFSADKFIELKEYCDTKGIQFLSTPFDLESVDLLAPLMNIFKVPSGEITNLPYLRKIDSYKKDVILSTGMATLEEIQEALNILKDCKVSLLHCTTEYPCPYEAVNMSAMLTLKDKFNLPVGYSDHTQGIEIPIMAVSMGAEIIEKHFTLDKNMEGPDHRASLEPYELKQMVKSIRNVEKAFGNGIKAPQEAEKKNIEIARRSIVAKRDIKQGEIFSEENITCKRPATGISPMLWDKIIGKTATKDFSEDEIITL